ncbi:glycosyl transferase [Neorhizobium sp. T786]|uniref:glycosyl transferase n=1 Tax=Pseudorhizobium xiangyangii TaxID=2883104 RepID=UPI001CFFF043|nr:glycosyl transferase [Neorhizobium xiangyangii]MCB5201380.1 glycosyl transferase [Neorhizobium xiangyangii]
MKSDRPLRRSLIKILGTVFLGKSKAHAQNAWPGLVLNAPVEPVRAGGITYRGRAVGSLLHPLELKKEAGEEIVIVGSGPSINDNNPAAAGPRTAILLNGAVNLIGSEIQEPLAVAIEDERFVWRHFALMREKITGGMICLLSVGVIRAICENDPNWLADKRVMLIDDIRKPYRGPRRKTSELTEMDFVRLSGDGSSGFSGDPARGVFQGGSVATSALQFAIFCAPRRIGFFGFDISNADTPRFYERAGETAKSGVARAQDRILGHVAIAKSVCEERGIELLNFSAVSALRDCGLPYDARYARRSAAAGA